MSAGKYLGLLATVAWLAGGSAGHAVAASPEAAPASPFAGSVLLTPDEDWRARWGASQSTNPGVTPKFTEASTLAHGKKAWLLIFFSRPSLDAAGNARISTDLRFIRPDGKPALDQRDVACFEGRLVGRPGGDHLCTANIEFVGEAADPAGTWRVQVTLRDKLRGTEVPLFTTFTLR
jgi:hypothetical protein